MTFRKNSFHPEDSRPPEAPRSSAAGSFHCLARRTLYRFGFIAFGIIFSLSAIYEMVKLKGELSSHMRGTASSCAGLLRDTLLEDREYLTELVRQAPAGGEAELRQYFFEKIPLSGCRDHYFVLSPEGTVILTGKGDDAVIGLDFSHLDFPRPDANISLAHPSAVDLEPVVTIGYDLPGGGRLLVEKNILAIAPLVRHLRVGVQLEKAIFFILSEDGTVVYHPDTALVTSRHSLGAELKNWSAPDMFGLRTYDYKGTTYVSLSQPLDSPQGWIFYAAISRQQLYALIGRHLLTMAIGVAVIFAVLLVSLQSFISRRLSTPLAAIAGYLSALNPMEDRETARPKIAADTLELQAILKASERMAANIRSSKERLVESEELFRTVTEFSTDWIFWLSPEEELIYVSPSCATITGYTPEEFYEQASLLRDIIHPEDRPRYVRHVATLNTAEPQSGMEYRIVTKSGQVRWVSHVCVPIHDGQGNYLGSRGRNADITARKATEESLRESEERFRTLMEQGADVFLVHENDGGIIDVNRRASEALGYSREELLAMQVSDLNPYHSGDDIRQICRAMAPGETVTLETAFRRKDGSEFAAEVRASVVAWGKRSAVFSLVRDVTARKAAQDELAAEKELLTVTLRSIGDGVIAADKDGRVLLLSRAAEKLTGWTTQQAAGRTLAEIFQIEDEESRARCEEPAMVVLESGPIISAAHHATLVARDGTVRPVAWNGAPICDRQSRVVGVVLVFRDVAEERRLEQEAQKAQRLESLGLLAGGIAHDFNNLLTAILGNISFVRVHIVPEHEDHKRLLAAEKASEKAKRLTQQLLTFARGGAPIKEVATVSEIVREAAEFALHGARVRVEFDFAEDLAAAEVDVGQISQVFHNIMINAEQAMPQGGLVRIRARNYDIEVADERGLRPGPYLEISVQDNGEGIDPENIDRIFDPYFTTRKGGNGLGLATCYSIIKRHDGHIEVESVKGRGSTFRLYLPATGKEPVVFNPEDDLIMGSGRVLVMDDDEMVRELAGAALEALGYDAALARDGGEAVALYAEAMKAGRPFAVVIMDLTVPGGVGGKEAMQSLRRLDPQVKAVVSSGYAQDPIMANHAAYGFCAVLAKPYSIKKLGELLHAILAGDENPPAVSVS